MIKCFVIDFERTDKKREAPPAGYQAQQPRTAATLGAEIPESEAEVDRVLGRGAPGDGP